MTEGSEQNNLEPESTKQQRSTPSKQSNDNDSHSAENKYLNSAIKAFSAQAQNMINNASDQNNRIQNRQSTSSVTEEQEKTSICPQHEIPLNFWSNKDQVYQCIKCLINEKEVHYIDDSYKRKLEEFKKIRNYGSQALAENNSYERSIDEWRDDIRDIVSRVHVETIEIINTFTTKLIKSLSNIQSQKNMLPFAGEQRRQRTRIEFMRERYIEIQSNIDMIEASQPNLRAAAVKKVEDKMHVLEQEMIAKDKEMKKVNAKLQQAIKETVDLEPLSSRIFKKFINNLEYRVEQDWKNFNMVPKSKKRYHGNDNPKESISSTKEEVKVSKSPQHAAATVSVPSQNQDDDDPEYVTARNELTKDVHSASSKNNLSQSQRSECRQDTTMNMTHSDLRLGGGSSIVEKYKGQNKDMLFHLKANSQDIFFMDFASGNFVNEKVKGWSSPTKFSTQQTSDGKIYIVGGYRMESGAPVPIRNCTMLDKYLQVTEMDTMQSSRFDIPLALVHDRFILAMGGKLQKQKSTSRCEAYDIETNHWFQIESLPLANMSTSATVMNNREVYILPEINRASAPNILTICRLDTGGLGQFPKDTNKRDYGYVIAQHRWTKLEIRSPDLQLSNPTAGLSLNTSEMLIFGGATTKCFILDTSQVNNSIITIREAQTQLVAEYQGAYSEIHQISNMETSQFAIDANRQMLYHCDTSTLIWKTRSLKELCQTQIQKKQ